MGDVRWEVENLNKKLSVEVHILPQGAHGYGLRKGTRAGETWPILAEQWLIEALNTIK